MTTDVRVWVGTGCLAIAAVASVAAATAARAAAPHQHGVARLDLALDGAQLTVALELPQDTLLGHERAPRTAAERQAAAAALQLLRDGAALFRPDAAAGCTLQQTTVRAPLLEPVAAASAATGHADADAEYTFRCAAPERLQAIGLPLFERVPRLQRLDVQMATPRGQGQARLQRGTGSLKLPR